MKNKKTLFAVILILFLVIGVTIAYFTSSASFENIFNTGTYKVVTTEVFESPDNWKPGEEIPKTITTTNEGTIPAAVRVSYTEKWEDKNGTDITTSIPEGAVVINLDNTSDWTKEGNYYYYNYILNPNETTSSFIKSVTLNAQLGSGDDIGCTPSQDGKSVTCEATDSLYGAKYKLTITKETVQADKYQEVWNTNVEINVKNSDSSSNNGGNTTQKTWNYYHYLDEESYGDTTSEFNNSWVVWTQENTNTNEVEVCRKIDDTTICVEPGHYTEVTCNGDNCSVSEYLSNIKTELESHDLECDVSESQMNCSNILIYDFSGGYAEFDDDSGAYCAIYGYGPYCGH